jgi:hypothetical protein
MADLRARLPVWAPSAVVFLIAAAGLVRVLTEHWRQGGVILGGAVLVAAVLRAVLDPDQLGLLAIRSRVIDVACYAGLGIAMVLLSVTITRGQLTFS